MFTQRALLRARLRAILESEGDRYRVLAPRLSPAGGAALYAAKISQSPLSAQAVKILESQLQTPD
jgi:hypothetical protein